MLRRRDRKADDHEMNPSAPRDQEAAAEARRAGLQHIAEAQKLGQEARQVKDSYLTQLGLSYGRPS